MGDKIWMMEVLANKYVSIIPHSLEYFGSNFIGIPLLTGWVPPPITIAGKSKKLADTVSWMTKSPAVSERMKNILQPLCGESVQFLKFHDLKNKPYYAMNVLAVVEDIVDLECSKVDYVHGSIPPKPYNVKKYIFQSIIESIKLPLIFKVSLGDIVLSDIFVSQSFVDIAIAEKLTGFALMDPARDAMYSIIRGDNLNDVEGIVG